MKEMIYSGIKRGYEILYEDILNGYHFAIVSLWRHPCAYVELSCTHPLYEKYYDDLDIYCHGGLTYSEHGLLPIDHKDHRDGWWIGWDYAHTGDYTPSFPHPDEKKWTTQEIFADVVRVIDQLKDEECKRKDVDYINE